MKAIPIYMSIYPFIRFLVSAMFKDSTGLRDRNPLLKVSKQPMLELSLETIFSTKPPTCQTGWRPIVQPNSAK
jgi:hypothetical protein